MYAFIRNKLRLHAGIENHDMTCEILELKRKKKGGFHFCCSIHTNGTNLRTFRINGRVELVKQWERDWGPQFSPDHSKAKAELENAFLCKTSQEMQFLQAVLVLESFCVGSPIQKIFPNLHWMFSRYVLMYIKFRVLVYRMFFKQFTLIWTATF